MRRYLQGRPAADGANRETLAVPPFFSQARLLISSPGLPCRWTEDSQAIFYNPIKGQSEAVSAAQLLNPLMKHLTNAEVGLRPVGAIGAYAPEGMWNAEG